MNLFRAQKALLAVQRYENRHLRVRRPENDADVRELAHAGLIQAALSDGSPGSITSLGTLTDAGRRFLRTFPRNYRFCDAALSS